MKNKKNMIIASMLVLIAVMAIGYAYFATRLNINATGNITTNWNVYFSNITDGTIVGSASNNTTPSVTATTATMDANLVSPGDSITYEITLTNGGTVGAIIENIKAEATGSSAIIYSISGIKIGDKLAGGASTTITVKIEYDENTTSQPVLTSKSLTITIDAVQDIGQTITVTDPVIENSVCQIATDSEVAEGEYGAKYYCKVDPNKPDYTFYLIDNNDDGTSDLIMNANINAAGEAVIPGVTEDEGHVTWGTEEFSEYGGIPNIDTDNGPVSSMTYLYNATKSWTNVDPLNYTYTNTGVGYTSLVSENGIVRIEKDSVELSVIGSTEEPLRARMPMYSTDTSISELGGVSNEFLYYNLGSNDDNTCSDIYGYYWGYWSLTTESGDGYVKFAVSTCAPGSSSGIAEDHLGTHPFSGGVRPVITVKL